MLKIVKEQTDSHMNVKRNHLYAAYLKERENADVFETDWGIAVYKWGSDNVYLQDIYVIPEMRQSGLGVELMEYVEAEAVQRGIYKMYGSVAPSTPFSDSMLRIMLKLGFKLSSSGPDMIYLIKDIKEPK